MLVVGGEAPAIVTDLEAYVPIGTSDGDAGTGGMGMPGDIGQGLLSDAVQSHFDLGTNALI